ADIVSGGVILYGNGDLTFTISSTNIGNGGFGDINEDGFVDAISNGQLIINNTNNNNWLKINTVGVESNLGGIGARVELSSASGTQIREVRSGEGFRNMSTLNTHFGLGQDTEITSVTIYWPSGIVDIFEDLDINMTHKLVEGNSVLNTGDFLTNDISIFPVPALDNLTISNIEDIEDPIYTVFDITGRKVMHGRLLRNNINISQLTSGQYILRIAGQKLRRNNVKAIKFTKR
ncbi:MAG: ASPIC/UnbV domain-containing protein, partial [Ulvibacter sp.]|nr:ASPIC/UnbV domain-containing protein [Ulvibacter sp.]